MMTPDLAMIAEVMLAAEGFREARILAKKTVTLYNLMIQQLSKQVRCCLAPAASAKSFTNHPAQSRVRYRIPRCVCLFPFGLVSSEDATFRSKRHQRQESPMKIVDTNSFRQAIDGPAVQLS